MWSITDNGACYTGASGEAIGQTGILTVGTSYLFSIEVSGITSGKLRFDSITDSEFITEDGTYQFYGVATIPDLSVTALDYGSESFEGCVKFIYAVEIPDIKVYNSCSNELVYTVTGESMMVYKSNVQIIIPWDLPDNTYYVQITDSVLEYKSECFRVGSYPCTLLLSWTNTDNAFGINYEALEQVNKLRVEGKLWNVKPSGEKTFFEFSNGEEKLIYSKVKMNQDLTIKALPSYLIEALGLGTNHDTFKIDGFEYIAPDEEVSPNWRKSSKTAPVSIVVRKKTSNLINRNCK